jgi:hypothetical protein
MTHHLNADILFHDVESASQDEKQFAEIVFDYLRVNSILTSKAFGNLQATLFLIRLPQQGLPVKYIGPRGSSIQTRLYKLVQAGLLEVTGDRRIKRTHNASQLLSELKEFNHV